MKNLKVLMATMGLGLGGAETHIVELSCELARQGRSVGVISNGGVYVEELSKYGIPHFNAPMNTRSVAALIKSFFILRRTIKKFKPDVVHAHARIPAFLCSILCKWYKIPFVTTVHFNFKTSGLFGRLSAWGSRSIAVSQDLKNYLEYNYDIPASNITLTVNGIATNKFSPDASDGGLREELGISRERRMILNVSRMDHNACEAAFRLIDSAENIRHHYPNSCIVLVGGGDAEDEIRRKADEANDFFGEQYIYVTGGRSDISRFCASCDVFVGVSRAALEAMSCAKPTILAGNQGYLGLYFPEKLRDCVATNFTCRGIPYPSDEELCAEICKVLSLTDEQRSAIGALSREIVLTSYSVGKMADDAAKVYDQVQYEGRKKYDYVLCGYYGFNNTGDEAMLSAAAKNLLSYEKGAKICVLTKDPSVPEDGITTCFSRFSPFDLIRAIKSSRVMVFGGGNLIQDTTSTKSLIYYLTLLSFAQRHGVKTMLYANGIGPVTRSFGRKKSARVLDKVDVITLREPQSLEVLKDLGVTNPNVFVTADEVLTLFEDYEYRRRSGYIAVALRNYSRIDPDFNAKLADALNILAKEFDKKVVIVPLQQQRDLSRCEAVGALLNCRYRITDYNFSYKDNMRCLSEADVVIGMRLHALVFAAGAGVPAIGLVYDPKIEGFLDYIGIKDYFKCESISTEDILAAGRSALSVDDETLKNYKRRASELIALAKQNAKKADDLLENRTKGADANDDLFGS